MWRGRTSVVPSTMTEAAGPCVCCRCRTVMPAFVSSISSQNLHGIGSHL